VTARTFDGFWEWVSQHPIITTDLGIVQHPMFVGVPMSLDPRSFQPITIDERFVASRAQEIRHRTEDQPLAILGFVERAFRPEALMLLWDDMTIEEQTEGFGWVWTDTEFPGRNPVWPALWRMVDTPFTDGEEAAKWLATVEGPHVPVYRGATGPMRGIVSLSLSHEVAQRFASRFGQRGHVTCCVVSKRNIIGVFFGRGEREIVVRARNVT
jgi:hypothetical protein